MKISRRLKKMIRRSMHRKDGITVIEVLTSLVVATIGVFGVLVLIPFAVKQSQLGLDQDAAGVVAENAIEDMQVYGFTRVGNDGSLQLHGERINLDNAGNPTVTPYVASFNTPLPQPAVNGVPLVPLGVHAIPLTIGGASGAVPQVIHFDPVAVAEIGFPVVGALVNPDFLTGLIPSVDAAGRDLDQLRVTVATALSGGTFNIPGVGTYNDILRRPELEKIFRSFDDQTYTNTNLQSVEVSDSELPQPVFDFSSAGNPVKRQASGRLSWSALLVPQKDDNLINSGPPPALSTISNRYKAYVLVYADRSFTPIADAVAAAIVDPDSIAAESLMRAYPVRRRATTDRITPDTHGGFDSEVKRINLAAGVATTGVFKDDWVMLINRKPLADYSPTLSTPPQPPLPSTLPIPVMTAGGAVPIRLDADEEGYRIQISFAKVLAVAPDFTGTSTVLSVDGGPFNFYYTDVHGQANGGVFGSFDPGNGTPYVDTAYTSATYVIHLKNVLNVYERTISLERDSIWN